MIIGILFILVLFISFATLKRDKFLKWVFVGTIIRLALISIYFLGVKLPESGGDAKNFFYEGLAIFNYLFFDGDKIQTINPYSSVTGFSMIYSGDNIALGLVMNTICYIIIAYALYEIVKLLTADKKAPLKAVIILSLFPMDILYSTVLLREQTIIMFLILSFLYLLKYVKNGNKLEFLLSIVFHICAVLFHSGILFLLAVHLFVFVFYKRRVKVIKFKAFKIGTLVVLGLIMFYFLGKTYKFAFLKDIFSIEYLNHVVVGRFLDGTGTGRTAYLMNLMPSNLVDFILYLPIRIIYFMFSPFLWMVGGAGDIFVLIDGFIYLVLIFLGIKKWEFIEPKLRKVILYYFLAFAIVFSIGTTNFGTAMRHRHKILWLVIAVAVVPKKKLIKNYEKNINI